jgi:membrane protease YdiL (CAAX protease family)
VNGNDGGGENTGRLWAALVFAMTFPALMAWLYFIVLAGPSRNGANLGLVLAFAAGKVVQFSFPVLYQWAAEGRRLRLQRPHFNGMAQGLGFGLAVAGAIGLLYHFALQDFLVQAGAPAKIRAKVVEFGLDTPAGFMLLAAFIAVLHSLLEEYYWRWFVFGRLRQLVPVSVAVLVANLAFMAHHVIVLSVYLPGPGQFWKAVLPLSMGVAAGGAVWSWLYHHSGSIYSPWVSHLVIDAALMAVGYDLLFGR